MHVVQILPSLNDGGVERGTVEIAAALAQAGHRATVISSGGRLVQALESLGAAHLRMPVHAKRAASLAQIAPLGKALSALRADVVHARSRLPAWLASFAMRRMPSDRRPHFVTTVHGLYSVNAYSAVMTRGERVIAISAAVRDYILRNYPRCRPTNIRLIHRGVDGAEFPRGHQPSAAWRDALRREFPQLAGKRLLVLPGRLTRWKGAETFLRLVASLARERDDLCAALVGGEDAGSGRFGARLALLREQLGLSERVVFAGSRPDMREWLSHATLTFNLSTRPEPFGRTVIEALSLGVPVIAFDAGGPAETLAACFPQGLVPHGNFDALVARASSLLDGDIPPVKPCPFSLQRMQRETLAVYEELAGAP